MRACFAFFKMQFIKGLQYRAAAWAGVFTQFFWGFMEMQLYRALYADHTAAFPMRLTALGNYIWLRQALFAMLNTWSAENELFDSVLSGNIAYELCRPVGIYGMWFSRTAALRTSRAALRCLPILVFSFLLPAPWGMTLPVSAIAFAEFLLSLLLAVGVTCAFTLILYFSCFYTVSSDGIRAIVAPVVSILSGELLPLPFLPDGLARILNVSPFGAMMNAPLRIYGGDIAGAEAASMLALQAFWLIAMVALGKFMQVKGMKKLAIVGG